MNMTKEKSWLFAILGVVAILFVTGAFKEFLEWKDDTSPYVGGGLTVGVGIVSSLLAHNFGWIDGNTRNLIIGASIASGATTAFGDKAESWGNQLAKKIRGKAKGAEGPRGERGRTGAPADLDINYEQGEFNDDMLTSFTPHQQQRPVQQQAVPPIPQQQPVQQVIHQPAPQQSSGNSTANIIGSILGPLAQFGSAWVSTTAGPSTVNIGVPGSAGSNRVRMGAFN